MKKYSTRVLEILLFLWIPCLYIWHRFDFGIMITVMALLAGTRVGIIANINGRDKDGKAIKK